MKKKLEKLRQQSRKELETELAKAKKEILQLKAKGEFGETKDTQAIKKKKREIARILTFIKEKQK